MSNERRPGLRLRVTGAAERAARNGHPWIFAESVKEQNREGETGELAAIYDRLNKFLAVGLYDPHSPIRVRILARGRPQTIDEAWLKGTMGKALARREGMFDSMTTGYRCINGESDGLPGMVVDRYGDALALKLYTTAWLPRLRELVAHLKVPGVEWSAIVLRLSRNMEKYAREQFGFEDGQTLFGEARSEPVIFLENGLRLESDPWRGQKTGFFLDQRDNRNAVREAAAGKSVLNLFSFSGGFSLAAAAGGATSAVSLDISEHALEGAKRNFALNHDKPAVNSCQHEIIRADAFEWLKQKPTRKFDIVVVDPPSLAKREAERDAALEAYTRLNAAAIERLNPGGLLVACSCSAHVTKEDFFEAVQMAAQRSRRKFVELQTTGHAPDHAAKFREGEYLKAIFLIESGAPYAKI